MLKTIGSSVTLVFRVDGNEVVGGGDVVSGDVVGRSDISKKSAKSKSRTKSGYLGKSDNLEEPKFLISDAKKAFNRLRQAYTKALILQHFDPECYIWIETNVSGYAIEGVLSQLTTN